MMPKGFKIAMDYFIKFADLEVATSGNKTDFIDSMTDETSGKILSKSKEWAMTGNHCDVGRYI